MKNGVKKMLSIQQIEVIARSAIASQIGAEKLSKEAETYLAAKELLATIGKEAPEAPEAVKAELDARPKSDFSPITEMLDSHLDRLDTKEDQIKDVYAFEVEAAKTKKKIALAEVARERMLAQNVRRLLTGKTSVRLPRSKTTSTGGASSYRPYKFLVDVTQWVTAKHEDGRVTATCPICGKTFTSMIQGFRQHVALRHQEEAEKRGYVQFTD